jgi:thioredoxin 1
MKRNKLITMVVIGVVGIIGTAVSIGASVTDTTKIKSVEQTKKVDRTILFFMNPNGMPCQMQNQIISGMTEKLNGKATVTRIKTTVPEDRPKFSEYGIRGLPMLIIVDGAKKEIKRFTPGIQSEETILDALK